LGKNVDEWEGSDYDMITFHYAHLALAYYRHGEHNEGEEQVKKLLEDEGIKHDKEYENAFFSTISRMDRESEQFLLSLLYLDHNITKLLNRSTRK
jgi:hypothetical protein